MAATRVSSSVFHVSLHTFLVMFLFRGRVQNKSKSLFYQHMGSICVGTSLIARYSGFPFISHLGRKRKVILTIGGYVKSLFLVLK